jgi:hypothetical protein
VIASFNTALRIVVLELLYTRIWTVKLIEWQMQRRLCMAGLLSRCDGLGRRTTTT